MLHFSSTAEMPLSQAIPLGLQYVLAMFVGSLTPLLIITGTCGIASGEFADLHLLRKFFPSVVTGAWVPTLQF